MSARLGFRRSQRLRGQGAFKAVIDARARAECGGAFAVHACPSSAPRSRLGISIGRRVGCAARRNRIKRLLREAYRLSQHEHPSVAYDIVVTVRPHEPLSLDLYRSRLVDALATLDATWTKRANRKRAAAAEAAPRPEPDDDGPRLPPDR